MKDMINIFFQHHHHFTMTQLHQFDLIYPLNDEFDLIYPLNEF